MYQLKKLYNEELKAKLSEESESKTHASSN
jgi:hypothetical protein